MTGGFDDGERDLEAAEYVLGTLGRDERAAFVARLPSDPTAQRSVAGWEARFAGLAGRLDAVTPPAHLWERIEQAIGAAAAAGPRAFKIIEGGGRPIADESLRRSRNRWRTGAIVSGLVAAGLLFVLGTQTLRPPPAPDATYVAAVNRGGDKPALIVRVDMRTGKVLVRPVAAAAPAGKSLELWYIGADKTPRSMGVVATDAANLALPAGAAGDNATFAVSVEPPGGSKSGSPTGPVVYAGQLVKE